ncbi:MAG: phosphotransferase [Atopobiaceae bacterium]|nr:phosphotransferase [Atopobiaceae bacterium]
MDGEERVIEGRISHPRFVDVPANVRDAIEGARMWEGKELFARPLSGGLTNENWFVSDGGPGAYFLKVPGVGTESTDRHAGDVGAVRASDLGIGAKVCEFDQDTGIEITEFLDGYETCTTTSLRTEEQGIQAMGIYRKLHSGEPFEQTNTLFEQVDQHLDQVRRLGIRLPAWACGLVDEYEDVRRRFETSGLDIVPCHNDPMPGNFMVRDGTMKIIDFETCGNNEASCEIGLFLSEMFYEDEDSLPLIEECLGRVTTQSLSRIQASRVIGDLKWGLWGLINSVVRDVRFDYWKYGTWKLMRAKNYQCRLDWGAVKNAI